MIELLTGTAKEAIRYWQVEKPYDTLRLDTNFLFSISALILYQQLVHPSSPSLFYIRDPPLLLLAMSDSSLTTYAVPFSASSYGSYPETKEMGRCIETFAFHHPTLLPSYPPSPPSRRRYPRSRHFATTFFCPFTPSVSFVYIYSNLPTRS